MSLDARLRGRLALAATLVTSLTGCPRRDGASEAAGDAGTAAAAASSAEAGGAPLAAAPIDASAFAGGFKGTIDARHAIVVHLVNTAGALEGSYYYAPNIEDLKLRGTVSSAGVVHLDESSKAKPSGAFDGHLGAGGSFDGTWTSPDKARSLAVHLEPVHTAAGAAATVLERRRRSKSKPSKAVDRTQWPGEPVCDVDIAYPDLVGSLTPPATELQIDQALQKDALEDLEACEEPFSLQESYKIVNNGAGVLSLQQSVNQFALGAAHPNYAVISTSYALPSGRTIALTDLLTDAGLTMLEARLVASLSPDVGTDVKAMVASAFDAGPPDFSLDRYGMTVSLFNSLPHAYQGAGANGTVVTKRDLAPFRKRPSPADELWGP